MDKADRAYWEEAWQVLAEKFSCPPELKDHIDNMAARNGISPWQYVLRVLYQDFDQRPYQPENE